MKKIVLKILLGLDVAALIVLIIYSQFLIRVNSDLGIITDGFGRELSRAPVILRMTGVIDDWAGIGWFIVDLVIGIALLTIAYFLFVAATDKKK